MRIRGKLHIETLDVRMYEGIAELADKKKERIEEELIPTFIIDEALNYYSQLEKYEVCTPLIGVGSLGQDPGLSVEPNTGGQQRGCGQQRQP